MKIQRLWRPTLSSIWFLLVFNTAIVLIVVGAVVYINTPLFSSSLLSVSVLLLSSTISSFPCAPTASWHHQTKSHLAVGGSFIQPYLNVSLFGSHFLITLKVCCLVFVLWWFSRVFRHPFEKDRPDRD